MNKSTSFSIAIAAILLTGCGTAKLTPVDPASLNIQGLPKSAKPKELKESKKSIERIVVSMNNYVPNNVDIASKKSLIKQNSRVVISIPASKKTDTNTKDKEVSSFKTAGYFNIAEQYVEKSLIRKGFDIIDRARLEAKIRDLNKISVGDIHSNNMFDKAEVIRAAKSGEVRADYIIQINNVNVSYNKDNYVDLTQIKEIQDYIQERDIKFGNEGSINTFPKYSYVPMYVSQFNAKMTDVQSGSVIWIGNNLNDSRSAKNSKIEFTIQKVPSNIESMNKSINKFNNDINQNYKNLTKTYNALILETDYLSTTKEFKNEQAMMDYKNRHFNLLNRYKKAYANKRSEYIELASTEPKALSSTIKYTYTVIDKQVIPLIKNENTDGKDISQFERDMIRKHKDEIVSKLISDTIETIKIQGNIVAKYITPELNKPVID